MDSSRRSIDRYLDQMKKTQTIPIATIIITIRRIIISQKLCKKRVSHFLARTPQIAQSAAAREISRARNRPSARLSASCRSSTPRTCPSSRISHNILQILARPSPCSLLVSHPSSSLHLPIAGLTILFPLLSLSFSLQRIWKIHPNHLQMIRCWNMPVTNLFNSSNNNRRKDCLPPRRSIKSLGQRSLDSKAITSRAIAWPLPRSSHKSGTIIFFHHCYSETFLYFRKYDPYPCILGIPIMPALFNGSKFYIFISFILIGARTMISCFREL